MNILKSDKFINKLIEINGPENVLLSENMSHHTTFRIGGSASVFATPENETAVVETVNQCLFYGIPFEVIGKGSNLLVSDEGFEGVIICLCEKFNDITVKHGDIVYTKAGASLIQTTVFAAENCLSGMEFASGIPGSCGGAVMMNAGAYDGEIKNIFSSCEYLYKNGEGFYEKGTADIEKAEFEYRNSYFKKNGCIVLSAEFKLVKKDGNEGIYDVMRELGRRRISKQPLDLPSAGSAFKRPLNGFAAKLIDECGLRGYSVGDAQVSEKHCGFVVNKGKATSSEVYTLLNDVRKKVFEMKNVNLEPEICFLGKMTDINGK